MRPEYNFLNVVDLEATCGEGVDISNQDIIEIGIAQIDRSKLKIVKSDSILVKPSRSVVTKYCTNLTGHTQEELDRHGISFVDACERVKREYNSLKYGWFSHGNWDYHMIESQCKVFGVQNPMGKSHINSGMLFAILSNRRKGPGAARMWDLCKIEPEGRHHNGRDDAYNTAKALIEILKEATIKF